MRTELNARIGRTVPTPLGAALAVGTNLERPRLARFAWSRRVWMPAALLAALWPHWLYIARRTVDGSDEPWGILALATVVLLVARDQRDVAVPPRHGLAAAAVLAIAAAVAHLRLPDLLAAALATLAVAVYLVHALRRPATPLVIVLLLALPLVASLQFYFGFPLRVLVAHASALLLSAGGIEVIAAGASIVDQGQVVLIDAPCAGIGMLWIGSYTAGVLSYLQRASGWQTLANGLAAAALVLVANIARNTILFFPEAGRVDWPAWTHEAIGLAALGLAITLLTLFITRRSR